MRKNRSIPRETSFGDEVVRGLGDLLQSIRRGEPVTVRDVRLDLDPRRYSAEAVRRTRRKLGLSQAVFAKLLAVTVKAVQSWEQGAQEPSPIARRILDDMSDDPARWLAKLIWNKTKTSISGFFTECVTRTA
jgi:putative transcriptional regulator